MTDIEDMPLDKLIRKVERLRSVNSGLVYEIESLGGAVDLTMARVETFIDFLVDAGILTERQRWMEQHKWETTLRPQLISTRDRIKLQIEEARRHAQHVQKQRERAVRDQKPGTGSMEVGNEKSETLKLILPAGVKKDEARNEKPEEK